MQYTTPNKKVGTIFGTTRQELEVPQKGGDQIIFVSVFVLMIFGSLAVFSSIAFFAESHGRTAADLAVRHVIKMGIALLVMIFISKVNYNVLARFSRLAILFSWMLLFAVLIFGELQFGAKRSLSVGFISFQPSSIAASALILHVAVLLHEKQEYIKSFKRAFLPIMFWVVITCSLIAIEDFSSAAVLLVICVLMMFVGRISSSQIFIFIVIGLIGAAGFISASAERQSRISSYVTQVTEANNVRFDSGNGYQAQQAHIAIAQGEVFGVGIGKSTQRDFLPAPYNDFIFAIIAEEYGILGSSAIIIIFTLILFRGIVIIAKHAPNPLGTLLAVGATLMVSLYGLVNAAVATGLFPVTGLPMPFVSYGGTSMLFASVMTGILLNISKFSINPKDRTHNG